jgi:hypothetical protein
LDDPDDILRLEIATALGRDVLIVPVLVAGARMPKKNELPDDLRSLADRNALEITYTHFDHDIERLVSKVEQVFGINPAREKPKTSASPIRPMSAEVLRARASTENLAEFFGFTLEELALNRKGVLSERQRERIREEGRSGLRWFVRVGVFGLGLLGLAYLFSLFEQSATGHVGSITSLCFWGAFGIILIDILIYIFAIDVIRATPRVTTIVGRLGYYTNGTSIYVGRKIIKLPTRVHLTPKCPPTGIVYYLYCVGNRLMSIESEIS